MGKFRGLDSQDMLDAFETGNYSIDRPYAIRHRFNENIKSGLIYIMTSPTRLGETKIGATTLSVKERAKAYKSKYGYSVDAQNWKKFSRPFELEAIMAKTLRQYRVLGNTSGDSIEWYSLAEHQIWKMVLNTIGKC